MRRDEQRLGDILEALDAVAKLIAGRTEEDFLRDENLRYLVAWRPMIVGEAAATITAELKQRHPAVRWVDMVGLRNVLVHQYFGIHWRLVWLTASERAPALRPQIAEIIRLEFPPRAG